MKLKSAWKVNDMVCDGVALTRHDGVFITITEHPEVKVFIDIDDLSKIMQSTLKKSRKFEISAITRYQREVLLGYGATSKVKTAQGLERDDLIDLIRHNKPWPLHEEAAEEEDVEF